MHSRIRLLAGMLLIVAVAALAGCGAQPQAQADPGRPSDVLPTPVPIPTTPPPPPTATPVPAPGAQANVASTQSLLSAQFDEASSDLSAWQVIDSTDLVQQPSIWQVSNGRLTQVSDGEGTPGMFATSLVTGDTAWTDYEVRAAAYANGNDELGVVARANDQGYYVFRMLPATANGTKQILSRYDAASQSFVDIAKADGPGFEEGRWYELSVRVQGDQIQAFIGGQQVIDARDATLASGRAGVYGYAQGKLQFDNLNVQALPPNS
jgi:hypothetical protein